jgi:uncharacterized OB-fold protein
VSQVAFAPDVFTWPADEPQLIGGRCPGCRAVAFPPKEPYASGETPETFRPYGVGLVQLGDEVRVEGRLTESDPARLAFGMEVELVVVPFRVEEDGTEVVTYAFRPVGQEAAPRGAAVARAARCEAARAGGTDHGGHDDVTNPRTF